MTDRLLTSKEVGELLNLNEKTVRQMAGRGEIEAIRLGRPRTGRLRFAESAVDRFIGTQRSASE